MTQTRFTVLDETQGHPDLSEQIDRILHRVAPTVKVITDLPLAKDAAFLPTEEEIADPDAWVRRIERGCLGA